MFRRCKDRQSHLSRRESTSILRLSLRLSSAVSVKKVIERTETFAQEQLRLCNRRQAEKTIPSDGLNLSETTMTQNHIRTFFFLYSTNKQKQLSNFSKIYSPLSKYQVFPVRETVLILRREDCNYPVVSV